MKHSSPSLLCVLVLTLTFGAGLLGAADQPNVTADSTSVASPAAEAPAVPAMSTVGQSEQAERQLGCSGLPVPQITWANAQQIDIDPSPLNCNCNTHDECRRLCNNENASCFIGPVCDNWPRYTGKCKCGAVTPVEVGD